MGTVPPLPGRALDLAKLCTYDSTARCFNHRGELRWLYPEGSYPGTWTATNRAERTVSAEAYKLLRAGVLGTLDAHYFFVGEKRYMLVDDGFEATAVEV